jgi:hypothetical protein
MAARASLTRCSTLESPDGYEGRTPCLLIQIKKIPEPCVSFLRELDSAVNEDIRLDCMGGFVISMVYGFSRPTGNLDVFEIAPREAGRPMLELGMQGGPPHKKYKIYLDHVGVAMCRTTTQSGSLKSFPKCSSIFDSLLLILTISLCQNWNATSNVTEMM